MEGLRQKTLKAWVKVEDQIGPIPSNKLTSVIKGLRQCFTNSDNPWKSSPSNESFQRDLDETVEADGDFRRNPSLFGLLDMEAEHIHRWEKLTQQFHSRTQGLGASASVAKGKYSKQSGSSDYNKHAKSHDVKAAIDSGIYAQHVPLRTTRILFRRGILLVVLTKLSKTTFSAKG